MFLWIRNICLLMLIFQLTACGLSNEDFGPNEEQKKQIAERIAPVGQIIMAGDIPTSDVNLSIIDIKKVELSPGREHTVNMLNNGGMGLWFLSLQF